MELLQELPTELHMSALRFTPHPCAALMHELYRSDAWEDLLERRHFARWGFPGFGRRELSHARASRELRGDPVEALAEDRRTVLKLLSVYADTDDERLWSHKRARTDW